MPDRLCTRRSQEHILLGKPFAVLIAILLAGCSSNYAPVEDGSKSVRRVPEGVVVAGDTLYAIAWRYGVDYRDMARWNDLQPPYVVRPGQRLRLTPPERHRTTVAATAPNPVAPRSTSTAPTAEEPRARAATKKPSTPSPGARTDATSSKPVTAKSESRRASTDRGRSDSAWQWPIRGNIVRGFQAGKPGTAGIDIAATSGAKVRAARDGKVVYRGSGLPGYGRLIIVKHSESLLSAYGYLGETHVKEGEAVRGGESIADVGTGGGYRAPVLHFEIRRDGDSVDPLKYLPG